ncbi:hypothetical protein [Krasilnikovia cinnamomea]|uniref:hypothetical protein n=1 Tax=Krasilnikovia cinnamomea TaxID=349313 RepID=UPI00102CFF12|nr:hypothetical protein [Krasilnikovia cinnamomea]
MTDRNDGGGAAPQSSTELRLVRPVVVSMPHAAPRHSSRSPKSAAGPYPVAGGWSPAGPGARERRGRGADRARRRRVTLAAAAAVVAAVFSGVGLGALTTAGPEDVNDAAATSPAGAPVDPALAGYPGMPVAPAPTSSAATPPGGGTTAPRPTGSGHAPSPSLSTVPAALNSATAPASRPATAPPVATFAALSGESCPQSGDRGYFARGQASDWYSRSHGGWNSDGCGGRMIAVPMSGSATRDDRDNVIVWWFHTGSVRTGSCAVRVHVPDTGTGKDSAGKPAHYLVHSTDDHNGPVIGEFDVDQPGNRGRWVDAGRFPVTNGEISVQMVTRGIDFGSGRDGDHLGVSALRVDCRAA